MFKNFLLFSSIFTSVCVIQIQVQAHPTQKFVIIKEIEETPEICQLEPDTGMCKALFINWYYDVNTKQCEEFVYGGCRGNENNFDSYKDCMKTCSAGSSGDIKFTNAPWHLGAKEICQLPPETGLCNAHFRRWHYDVKQRQCLAFVYGGCGGNKNNFESLEACEKTCVAHP